MFESKAAASIAIDNQQRKDLVAASERGEVCTRPLTLADIPADLLKDDESKSATC